MKMKKRTEIIGYIKDIPVIKCRDRKDLPNGFVFYCEYCKRDHYHGLGAGHRVAHCNDVSSPFFERGYFVVHDSIDEIKKDTASGIVALIKMGKLKEDKEVDEVE